MNKDLKVFLIGLVSIFGIAGFVAWKEHRCFQKGGEVWECQPPPSTGILYHKEVDPCEVALNTHGRNIPGCGR